MDRWANPTWRDEAFVCALDGSTIGISGEEISEWKHISRFRSKVKLFPKKNKASLKLPENFLPYYNMKDRHSVISILGNNILVTVKSIVALYDRVESEKSN